MSSFSVTHWMIVAAIVAIVWVILRPKKGPDMVCTTCGHRGVTAIKTRGSMAIEVVLWLCFLVPGLLYSLWRLTTRHSACTSCGATVLVPPDSPAGRKVIKETGAA